MERENVKQVIKTSIFAFLGYSAYVNEEIRKRKRKFWVRELYLSRNRFGFYESGFGVLERDPELFAKAVRMTKDNFEVLHCLLEDSLRKNSQRQPIAPKCRLLLTLMYLAHGGPRSIYAINFRMAPCTVRSIILETCAAIWYELHTMYMRVPTITDWVSIANKFESKSGLPNCIGAIDGKHITITCPAKAGSQFFNYKKRHSIILLAICDSNYSFLLVDIGAYGSQSDGGVFKSSSFGKALEREQLDLPAPRQLPNSTTTFPHFLVGDAAFPLKNYLMRPYPGRNLTPRKEHFNKSLSRARVIVENSFGILAARWRVLRNDLHCTPSNAELIVKATLVLHNFLRANDSMYCPENYADTILHNNIIPGVWRQDIFRLQGIRAAPNNASPRAFILRDTLCDYLFEYVN